MIKSYKIKSYRFCTFNKYKKKIKYEKKREKKK